jgi:hypothetical protein
MEGEIVKTMIALVSDQRMQNVIPLLQVGAAYSELVLVMSKERRTGSPLPKYAGAAEDVITVLKPHLKVRASDEFVDPYDIEAVASTIDSLIEKCGGRKTVVVNISGGTKPMAIGALRAAQVTGVSCLYTNTEDREILWLSPDGVTKTEPIQVVNSLDVLLYIRAYGEKIADSKKVADLDATHKAWAEVIGDQHAVIYQKVVIPVTSAIKLAYKKKTGFPIACKVTLTHRQREVIEQLAQIGLWSWNRTSEQISVADSLAASFLNGTWVEVYVALQMQRSGVFNDVRLNTKLDGVEGEIDVAAVSNGRLVLVECKSNVQQSQQLSKLDSFRRRLGGPYAQAYYARASEAYAKRIRKQCQKFRLDGVFFGPELRDIGEQIGKNIGGQP